MKPWRKMTNDELVMHLELWLAIDGKVSIDTQREFFEEVVWRLAVMNNEINGSPATTESGN